MGLTQSKETNNTQNLKAQIKEKVWNKYPICQLMGAAPDQTTRFFAKPIPRETLLGSTKKIVQLGVASGLYLKGDEFNTRTRVGYDYSDASAALATFQHRLIDFEDTTDDTLNYQDKIDTDLSEPCDILIIRLLEYLDPNAATLLLASLIKTAQPGTTFYIDFNKAAQQHPFAPNDWPIGTISHFFQPTENFETKMYAVVDELGDEVKHGQTEEIVVTKL